MFLPSFVHFSTKQCFVLVSRTCLRSKERLGHNPQKLLHGYAPGPDQQILRWTKNFVECGYAWKRPTPPSTLYLKGYQFIPTADSTALLHNSGSWRSSSNVVAA